MPDEERIEFRIGVNLGDVVIDADDIRGDGPARSPGRVGRALRVGGCLRPNARPPDAALRGPRKTTDEEYRPAGAGLALGFGKLRDEWKFKQEYPANAAEAFQTSGDDTFIKGEMVERAKLGRSPQARW